MKLLLTVLSISCYALLAYVIPRSEFGWFLGIWGVLFGGYYVFLKLNLKFKEVFFIGLCFRLIWAFAIPCLSDDFYRFIWDGRLVANGLNPYVILPSEFRYAANFEAIIGDIGLYLKLNSPNYYTVYPPLNQFVFGLCAELSEKRVFANILWLRAVILLADIAIFYILKTSSNIKRSTHRLSLYFLNPLIIIELCGNLHFEGLVLLSLILSILLITRGLYFSSSVFLAFSVSVKMLPAIFIPLIISKLNVKTAIWYVLTFAMLTAMGMFFFVDKMLITRIFSSINLYFQHFEFNASIYYLIRAVGYFFYGYNIISWAGVFLSVITCSVIICLGFKFKNQPLFVGCLLILSSYFAFALVVHPWYISTLVGLAVFTPFRFPMVWSALAGLSYFAYAQQPIQENPCLLFFEYGIVYLFAFWELKKYLQRTNFSA